MSKLSALRSWMLLDIKEPGMAVAQLAELQRQIPLLYALLMVNAAAVVYTHYGLAPDLLTLGVSGFLFAVCAIRLAVWMMARKRPADPTRAVYTLRRTTILAGILAVAFVSWSLALDAYGGPYERGHVALFIAITVIGCIFCLMHLPQAALLVTTTVSIPYLTYYLGLENTVFYAIALNIALVTAVMVQVLLNSFSGFTKLVRSQADLAAKQSETQRLSEENARLAHTDSLTDLPNRRYFFARLQTMIEAAVQTETRFAVGLLDLDRFKPVNDTYGHVFGDRLLSEVGQRLRDTGGSNMTVARLGGDEFAFVYWGDVDEAETVGQRLCDVVSEPYVFDGIGVSISCSCGLAIFPDAGSGAYELFDRSDYALYNSKSSNRGRATLFSPRHETLIRSGRAIEAALQSADLDSELSVHFQPIVDVETNAVVAVEALARWTSASLGSVRPDQFIPVAERTGLIHRLTLTLFRKALSQIDRLPRETALFFNLSTLDITSSETILSIVADIGRSGVDPRRIGLELTETAVMRDFEAAARAIGLLRAIGLRIALDDFGTGYSSLGYLHRLPLDKVKIDRSFVSDLDTPSGRQIVAAVFGLCRNLDLDCIVEGVETERQLAQLRELGCRKAQGYLFARPMPMDHLVDWLAARLDDAAAAPTALARS